MIDLVSSEPLYGFWTGFCYGDTTGKLTDCTLPIFAAILNSSARLGPIAYMH